VNSLFLKAENGGSEPLGQRIVEMPQDAYQSNMLRNPRSGFVLCADWQHQERGRRRPAQH
jgi:hypothetical protein